MKWRVYEHVRGISDDPHLPYEYVRWMIATRTGWTLEYIDALPLHEVYEGLAVWSGENKANADISRVASW